MNARGWSRSLVVFAGLAVLLPLVLVALSLNAFRQFSVAGAEERARTAAEIVRVALTEAMANGTIGQRPQLFARLARVEGLADVRVVRGPSVTRQHGPGLTAEHPSDAIDQEVMASGRARYVLEEEAGDPVLRATIPYKAEAGSQPDCLQCHQAQSGEVLGALTLRISLAETRNRALWAVALLAGLVVFFALAALLLLRRQYQPIAAVAASVETVMAQAAAGDFTGQLAPQADGDARRIAEGVNRLMTALDKGIGAISRKVEQLMAFDLPRSRNMLISTQEMVEGLVDANRFKQAIEEDETKQEIYERLATIIGQRFDVDTFSIYEVANSKNHMRAMIVDGQAEPEIRWCDQQILIRADACRARRTGHMVNGIDEPGICTMFRPRAAGESHVCLPMILSGNAGCIVQLVARPDTAPLVRAFVPFLRVFLNETAPVLEAKRLMENLKESTLRDAMTGLYNRRFIEAYMETLVASVKRRNTHLAVLMLDVDHFKKVNDTYGHDAGDRVLVAVAKTLKQTLRASDLVVRYGGEEFIAFLQDTDGAGGVQAAEKVRLAVEGLRIGLTQGNLQKTISIGVADFPADGVDFWEVVKFADAALYAAKERGRNRVVRFTADLWQEAG
jgi:diguanylate cyclase (GGDEF)-like protein